MSLQKCANFSDCGPISACATDTRVQPEYPVLFSILEVGLTSHAQIRHIVLGCLASFSFFIMFNLCDCNFCENRLAITKISERT